MVATLSQISIKPSQSWYEVRKQQTCTIKSLIYPKNALPASPTFLSEAQSVSHVCIRST